MRCLRLLCFAFALCAGLSTLKAAILVTENFDNIATLSGSGWAIINNSSAGGTTSYFQGSAAAFSAQAGSATSYIAANFNNAPFGGAISNWLITPQVTLDNGVKLNFYTRTEVGSLYADTLEVRFSTSGASTNVGTTTTSTGDFSALSLSIDPTMTPGIYPENWTLETITLSGLAGPVSGRFAFRYLVSNTSVNGDYIGIDSVTISTAETPEPATFALSCVGGGFIVWAFKRRRSKERKTHETI